MIESHRGDPPHVQRRREAAQVGHGQRRDREGVLPDDAQQDAARDQDRQRGAALEQCDIVQQQQQALRSHGLLDSRQGGLACPVLDAQDARDMGDHERRVGQRREGRKGDAVGVGVGQAGGGVQGEARLAHAPRACQRQQADVRPPQQVRHGGLLALTPHQRGEGGWQGGKRQGHGCGRRRGDGRGSGAGDRVGRVGPDGRSRAGIEGGALRR